ncbi:MAG: conserved membrane protein of unknown function [Promethearchaeota archaeon]|jgi:hypothetical protein|nr:MAG: conserved membrane protein of unknown function [Candidatus Lokiarchaeota archaeon]
MSIDPILQIMLNVFSLIFVVVNLLVGARIISKYFELRNKVFIYIGFAWIGIAFPWLPEIFNLIFRLINLQANDLFLLILFAIVNLIVIPPFVILWILALNKLTGIRDIFKKILLISAIILSVVFELFIFVFLSIDSPLVGKVSETREYTVNWSTYVNLLLIVLLVFILVTGLIFGKESLNSKDTTVNLKGKFLLSAFVLFAIAAALDSIFTVQTSYGIILKIIARIMLMVSSILFYIGFIMPERIENWLIK